MIPMALAQPVIQRLGYRRILVSNTLLLGLLILAMSSLYPGSSDLWLLFLLLLLGAVNSMRSTAMNSVTLIGLNDQQLGSGNSLLSVVMLLSMSLEIVVVAALLQLFCTDLHGLQATFQDTFFTVGALTMLTSVVFVFLPLSRNRCIDCQRLPECW